MKLAGVVGSYSSLLEAKHPSLHRRFEDRRSSDPAAARAEAAVFSAIRANVTLEIVPEEDSGSGGPDFRCKVDENEFVIEVTHLESTAVTSKSNYEEERENRGGVVLTSRGMTLHSEFVYRIAQEKAGQVSGRDMPRIVAIVSEHPAADILMGKENAFKAICPEVFRIEVDKPGMPGQMTAQHLNAPFFSIRPGRQVSAERRSISAILLIALDGHSLRMTGLLHPDPVHPFSIHCLPKVPFVKISNWPCADGTIRKEWTMAEPSPAVMECMPVHDLEE